MTEEGGTSSVQRKSVTIYTDGACSGNPGRGGYAAVLIFGEHRRELTGGYRLTTSNRAEMMAVIVGLEALKFPCRVAIFSDSQVVLSYLTTRCIETFRRMSDDRLKRKSNGDLKVRLRYAIGQHEVNGIKVPGHSGIVENERCDQLAVAAMNILNLPEDVVYESKAEYSEQPV